MDAFTEARFPEELVCYGSSFGPVFSTDVLSMDSGGERRNANWAYPRHKGTIVVKGRPERLARLRAFFFAVRGRASGFRFKDWLDFQMPRQVIGAGDGARTSWPLVKTYEVGGLSFSRPLAKPVAGTVRLFVAGQEALVGWSCDHAAGLVAFAAPPAAGASLEASCEFDVPVRFDTDVLDVTLDLERLGSITSIPLLELRR